jgi:hypothetical protein
LRADLHLQITQENSMSQLKVAGALLTGDQDIDDQDRTLLELGNRAVVPSTTTRPSSGKPSASSLDT